MSSYRILAQDADRNFANRNYQRRIAALSENPTTTLNIPKISPDFVDSFIGESVAETDEFYSSGWKHCEYEATGDSEIQVSSSKVRRRSPAIGEQLPD